MRCGFESRELLQGGADTTQAILEKQLTVPEGGERVGPPFEARPAGAPYHSNLIGRFLPIRRWMLSVFFRHDFGGSLFLINGVKRSIGSGKKGRGVMLAGNLAHGLQEAQLQRNRLLAHHRGGLHHFFRGLKFALGVDDLCAAFALGFGLLGHRALHRVGQRHVLYLDRRDFDAPRFGLSVDDLLQLLVDRLALRKQVIERRLAEHAAQRRLRDERSGLEKILHFHDRGLRIDHAEINNRIDRHRHVVARHHFLSSRR